MYCAHCGRGLPQKAKFCPDCGKTVQSLPENLLTKKPSLVTRLISLFTASAISAASIKIVSESSLPSDGKTFLIIIFGFLLLFTGTFFCVEIIKLIFRHPSFLFFPIKKVFMLYRARPKLIIPTLVMLAILVVGGRLLFHRLQYQQALAKIDPFQTVLAEALVIKSIGNDIQKSRTPAGWSMKKIDTEIQTVATALQYLRPGELLEDYREQSTLLMAGIEIAAEGSMQWEDLPDQPPYFKISLTDGQLLELFKNSLKRLADLKEFGDAAIERGDRNSMRYIAAKLAVQDHFLNSLSLADNPGLLASELSVYAQGSVSPGSMAGRKRNPCFGPNNCLADATRIIPGIWKSALGYTVGQTGATSNWQNGWNDATPLLEASGHSISGTGITQGESDRAKNPPLVQAFFDSCSEEGGTIGGTGGVKTRLPTTESGYTCWQPKTNGKCWKLLTYSGGTYAGGDAGVACPEENLLPPLPASADETPENSNNGSNNKGNGKRVVQPQNVSWDGNYSTQSSGNCGSLYSGTAPDQFSVRGNTVTIRGGYSARIDSSGRAQIRTNISESGVNATFIESFQFSNPGQPVVNGNFSANAAVEGIGINCSGSFSGRRVSS